MRVRFTPYGITREITGGVTEIELQDNSVGKLRQTLSETYPAMRALSSLMIAVNQEYAPDDKVIQPGDDVALIPPVSGG